MDLSFASILRRLIILNTCQPNSTEVNNPNIPTKIPSQSIVIGLMRQIVRTRATIENVNDNINNVVTLCFFITSQNQKTTERKNLFQKKQRKTYLGFELSAD